MTPSQTIRTVRLLLDDSRDWYPTRDYINKALNEAQLLLIKKYYQVQDERALRPLYRNTGYIPNGSVIASSDTPSRAILFPRSCRKKSSLTHSNQSSHIVNYIDKSVYFNYATRPDIEGARQPRFSYYTIAKESRGGVIVNVLYFTNVSVSEVADLWFIAVPPLFLYANQPLTDVGLSLPQEYHFAVAALAAEIINDIDVGEQERGQTVFQGQRVNIEGQAL